MSGAVDAGDMTFPAKCELCGFEIESEDDAMWWHGYGNCVEITDEMWAQWEREAEDERRNPQASR